MFDRDSFFSLNNLRTEQIDLPEMEGSIRVRELTQKQRTEIELMVLDGKDNKEAMRRFKVDVVIMGAVGVDGNPLFTENDFDLLNEKSASVIDRISNAILRLSGITKDEVKEMEKNS